MSDKYELFSTLDPEKVDALEDFYSHCNLSKERLNEALTALQAFGLTMAACAKAIKSSGLIFCKFNSAAKRFDREKINTSANSKHKPRQVRMSHGK